MLIAAYFAGRGETISRCAVQLHPKIVASLNRRHVAFFNLHRLSTLDTLGLVLYKRVFFHLSNLMHETSAAERAPVHQGLRGNLQRVARRAETAPVQIPHPQGSARPAP